MTRYEDLLKTRAFLTYSTDALERLNQHIITLRQDMITGKMQDKACLASKTEEIERLQTHWSNCFRPVQLCLRLPVRCRRPTS